MGEPSFRRRAGRVAACCILSSASIAEASTLSLKWGDVPAWAETHAPELARSEAGLRAARAERDADFRSAPPEVAYEREGAGEETEQRLTLEKSLENPWLRGARGRYWDTRIEAVEAERAYRAGEVLYGLRVGYVRLRLSARLHEEILAASEALTRLSTATSAREEEGRLSALEADLFRASLAGVRLRLVSLNLNRGVREAEWKARMGIGQAVEISLETDFGVPAVRLPEEKELLSRAAESAGVRALEREAAARRSLASVERRRSLPALRVYGGYKDVDPGEGGYAVGAAVTVPLFHANGAAVARARAESDEAKARLLAHRGEIEGEVRALRENLLRMEPVLAEAGASSSSREIIEHLATAYEEGWVPAGEFLAGLGIALDGAFDRASLLEEYYDAVLRLEWITGRKILDTNEGGSER